MAEITQVISSIPLLKHRDTVINFPEDQDEFVTKYEATNDHLAINTVPELNELIEQTNDLRDEVNGFRAEALDSKNDAAASATISTTQAGIATAKANEASVSASDALIYKDTSIAQATIATTQAGIATAKALEASNSADSALDSANIATDKEALMSPYYDDISNVSSSISSIVAVDSNSVNINKVATNEVNINKVALNEDSINIVAIDLDTNNFIGICAENIDDIKNASSIITDIINDSTTDTNSTWSSSKIDLQLQNATMVNQPTIISPTNGTIDFVGQIESDAFSTSITYNGVLDYVEWQLSTDILFTDIIYIKDDSLSLSYSITGVSPLTNYYVRVRYGSDNHLSRFSEPIRITTPNAVINAPTITKPLNNELLSNKIALVESSPYDIFGHSETHLSTTWQIATDSGFTNIVDESIDDTINLVSWESSQLDIDTTYYIRVKYKSSSYSSSFSNTIKFITPDSGIVTPSITHPTDGITINGSTLSVTASEYQQFNQSEAHLSSDWEIATDIGFIDIVKSSYDDEINLESWNVTDLDLSDTYYIRVKYSSLTYSSSHSSTVSFSTPAPVINTPLITSPTNGADDIGKNPSIAASAFAPQFHSETHLSSDWQIASDALFTDIIHQSLNDTVNLTSWKTPDLIESTNYFVRVKYNSISYSSEYSSTIFFTTKAQFAATYGLQWNNIADTYVRLGDAAGIPLSTVNNAFFNSDMAVHSKMKRCVLNANGTVNYYLHPTDSTKKADGTASNLTGADGNVMVQIAKFYCKYDNTDLAKQMWVSLTPQDGFVVHPAFIKNGVEVDYRYYRAYKGSTSGGKLISRSGVAATGNKTIVAFRTEAKANGTGWGLIDWNLLFAVQTLCFIEIGTFNAQAVLGNGNDTGSDYGMTTGGSNSIGNASSPATNDDTWMSYRGIENFYADIFEWIDGINMNERLVYTSNTQSTFASDVFSGSYTSTGVTLPSSGYIKDMSFGIKGFIPTNSTGGSDSTYVTDYVNSAAGARVAAFGGYAGNGLKCGAACLSASNASADALAAVGAGISF